MAVRTFNPKQVLLSVGGVPISGYSDGTQISVERTEDTFTMTTGADGYTTRVKTNDRTASMTITLAQSSPSNDILSGFAALDELSDSGVVPVLLKDNSGTSLVFSAQCWIRRYPTQDFAKSISNREWMIDMTDVEMFVGGNA